MNAVLGARDGRTSGASQIHRVGASVAFSGGSFLVVATLVTTMDPARFAGIGLVYVLCSVLTNLIRYGLFDATLAGQVPLAVCRLAARWLALIIVLATLVGMVAAVVLWLDLLAAFVVLGAGLSAGGDLARMVRFCDGRSREVLVGDVAWLVGIVVLAAAAWAGGLAPAVGAVGGWIIGGAGWTALALGDGPVGAGEGAGGPTGWLRALVGTLPMAASGSGPYVGYLAGMAAVTAVGRPSAASLLEVGRLVGMPAVTVYSGLRVGVVASSPVAPAPWPSKAPGAAGDRSGINRSAHLAAVGAAVASAVVLLFTVVAVMAAPAGIGSALAVARRWWPLIAASQLARLVVSVVSDAARPLLGPGAGVRIGMASALLGAVVPPALVLAVGDVGALISQLAVVGLIYALIQGALRVSPVAHRRTPHIRPTR